MNYTTPLLDLAGRYFAFAKHYFSSLYLSNAELLDAAPLLHHSVLLFSFAAQHNAWLYFAIAKPHYALP